MLGMSEQEFGFMTPPTFFLKLYYFNKARAERDIFKAELTRLQTLALVNIQLPSDKQLKKATELWEFEWEKEQVKELSPAQKQARYESLLKAAEIMRNGI